MTSITVDLSQLKAKIEVILTRLDEANLLDLIGQDHLAWIDKNFRDEGTERRWAPLSPNTIAQRGAGKPLQDTGRLRQSFTAQVSGNEVSVGTRNKIAPFHQYGTSPYSIKPRQGGALRFKTANGMVFTKDVNHPGLPARSMLPTKAVAEQVAVRSVEAIVDMIRRDAA